jgi:methane/ammonia monooxygenase subunit B
VVVKHASYRVPGRSVSATLEVTNKGDSPVELTEFETGGIRFLNAAVFKDDTGYPADMLAESGLTVEGGSIGPGETKTIQIQAEDAAWEVQRMADVVYDPDSRFGALLHFFDAQGKHHIAPIGGPLIPQFM